MNRFLKYYGVKKITYCSVILYKKNNIPAFNTNGIVYDNSPWRPGRVMPLERDEISEDNERKLKNVATRIMSNGVEVLVRDKGSDGKQDQVMIQASLNFEFYA